VPFTQRRSRSKHQSAKLIPSINRNSDSKRHCQRQFQHLRMLSALQYEILNRVQDDKLAFVKSVLSVFSTAKQFGTTTQWFETTLKEFATTACGSCRFTNWQCLQASGA